MNKYFLLMGLLLYSFKAFSVDIPSSPRSERAIKKIEALLKQKLASRGLKYGSPIFIRIFKSSSKLEVWVKKETQFELFKEYSICTFSGGLGPKTRQGDKQSPEGFYYVRPNNLNPWSSFHLSFNLGYPNAYDRAYGYTGSALMVHGNCVSIGCYAMTDKYINEIYALANAAFEGGQPYFRVHIFPFKLEPELLERYKDHKWYSFWQNLRQGYELFNSNKIPPNVELKNGRYYFDFDS